MEKEDASQLEMSSMKEEMQVMRNEYALMRRTADAHEDAKMVLQDLQTETRKLHRYRETIKTQEKVISHLQNVLEKATGRFTSPFIRNNNRATTELYLW